MMPLRSFSLRFWTDPMPGYTFYPYAARGLGLTFRDIELADDGAAQSQALNILADHGSAVEVVVWQGDRLVHREVREGAAPNQARGTQGQANGFV